MFLILNIVLSLKMILSVWTIICSQNNLLFILFYFMLFQVSTLKEEAESLKADRERMSSSMKDIIHGAEGYKVGNCLGKTYIL